MDGIKKYGFWEGWLSIVSNIILFGVKYWAGIASGSIALLADAWHTLSDSVSSIIVLIGIKASAKPADETHPFGHGRAELVSSLVVGILLLIISYTFARDSIDNLINRDDAVFGTLAIVVTIASIVIKEALAQFALFAYRKTGSQTLKADGWHHRSDALSSLVILVAILFGSEFWWLDGVLGILVSIMIAYTAYEILKETIDLLLGKDLGSDLKQKIKSICIEEINECVQPHHYHLHDYGHHKELTFHIKLPGKTSLEEAHDVATRIEERLEADLGIMTTIHMEPE